MISRRALKYASALALTCGSAIAAQPAPVSVTSEAFPGLRGQSIEFRCANLASGVTLRGSHHFGGLSSFRLRGEMAYLVSDAAGTFVGPVTRSDDGWITGLDELNGGHLRRTPGKKLRRGQTDSEALVLGEDGVAWIAFEGQHRIERYTIGPAEWLRLDTPIVRHDAVLRNNKGFEGLTRLADGRLLAISEGVDEDGQALAIYYRTNDEIEVESHYRPATEYGVTDLATDPSTGDVFVLERAFSRTTGPRARLVRLSGNDVAVGELNNGAEIASMNFFHGIDNMEALALERRPDGQLRAHILSDDNFSDIQRTVLVGLAITESPNCRP